MVGLGAERLDIKRAGALRKAASQRCQFIQKQATGLHEVASFTVGEEFEGIARADPESGQDLGGKGDLAFGSDADGHGKESISFPSTSSSKAKMVLGKWLEN
jgi:hypothetical protein